MKKYALLLFFAVLIVFPYTVYADGPYLNIPPTNAFSQINTTNGTVTAPNFISSVKLQGLGSTVITADNATQTIYISSGHITPVGDRFGWFAVNTSPNLQNQHFYNFSTGPGITATVSADDFILSAINFVNATSKICGAGNAVTAFDNSTGTFTCSPFIQTINGNSSANHFITGTLGHIKVTDTGSTHNVDILFKINNATCVSGRFSSYDNKTGNFVCSGGSGQTLDTISNIGTGQAAIYAGNTTNTHFQFKTLKQGQGITLTNNTNDVTIATNFKVNNKTCVSQFFNAFDNATGVFTCGSITGFIQTINGDGTAAQTIAGTANHIKVTNVGATHTIDTLFKVNNVTCSGNSKVSSYNNVTGIFTCTGGSGAIQTGANIGTSGVGFFKNNTGSSINLRNLTTTRSDLFTLTQSSNNVNLASPFKSNSIACVNQFVSAFSNVTGLYTCTSGNAGTVNTFQNIGRGGKGVLSAISSGSLQSKNITAATTLNQTITSNGTDVIINLGTDVPTLSKPNIFNPLNRFEHGIILGNNTAQAINGTIESARTYTGVSNSHAFSDYNVFSPTANGLGANSFDSEFTSGGTANIDHLRGFQAKFTHASIGTLGELSGFGIFSLTNNGGVVTNVKQFGGKDTLGTGSVTNQYGLFFPDLTKATNNWAIFTGLGLVHFGDKVDLAANLTAQHQVIIAGLNVAVTAEKTGSYTPSITDDVIVMNATSASRTLTLPVPSGSFNGKIFTIKMVGLSAGNVVQILPSTGELINGFTGFNMTHADEIFVVQSNGTSWNKLSDNNQGPTYYSNRGTTRWMSGAIVTAGTGTSLDVASTIYAVPWVVPATEQFDKLGIEVTTTANPTSTTCRLAIYQDNGNAYPSAIISGTDAGTSTTGAVMHKYNFTTPVTLHAGLYWKAVSCSTAATTQPTFRAQSTGLPNVLGTTTAGGLSQDGNMIRVTGITFGAMPTTFPAGGTVIPVNTLTAPLILAEMNKG